MKNKIIIISAITLIFITSILVTYKKNEARKHEIRETEKKQEIKKIEYVVCGSQKDLNNLKFDIREVIIVIALYNEAIDRGVQKGEKISGYGESINYRDYSYDEVEAASEIAAKKWCDYMEGK